MVHRTPPSRRITFLSQGSSCPPIKVRPDSTLGSSLALEAEEEPALLAVRPPAATGCWPTAGGASSQTPPAVAQHGRPGALHGDLLPVSGRNDALALCPPPPPPGREAAAHGSGAGGCRGPAPPPSPPVGDVAPVSGRLSALVQRHAGRRHRVVPRPEAGGGAETGLAPDRPLPGGARAGIETGAARSTEPPSR